MPGSSDSGITRLADAIESAEGYGESGARPTRNRNPGDLRGWASYPVDAAGFTIFPSQSVGRQALESQLSMALSGKSPHYSPNMTIAQFAAVWSPQGAGKWAKNVADSLGVGVDTPIKDVMSTQGDIFDRISAKKTGKGDVFDRITTTATPPPSSTESGGPVSRFTSSFLSSFGPPTSPSDLWKGIKEEFTHPLYSAKLVGGAALNAQANEFYTAKRLWQRGDKEAALVHFAAYLVPFVGPAMGQAYEQGRHGNVAGEMGSVAGLGAQTLLASPEARAEMGSMLDKAIDESPARAMIRGEKIPVTKGQTASEIGTRSQVEQGLSKSFVGKPLRTLFGQQQDIGRKMLTDIVGEQTGHYGSPEEFVDNIQQGAEHLRKAAKAEYQAVGDSLGKPTPQMQGPPIQTAGSPEEAQFNRVVVNDHATKEFGKYFDQLSPDQQNYILDQHDMTGGSLLNPRQPASSINARSMTTSGARAQFDALTREYSDLGDRMRAAFRRGDAKEMYDLRPQMKGVEDRIEQLVSKNSSPEAFSRYLQAKSAYAQAMALRDFGDTMDGIVKGFSPKNVQSGIGARIQEIPGPQLVEKIKDLGGRLDQAVGPRNAQAIRDVSEILSRAQRSSNMGVFAHYATSYGPAVYALEELRRALFFGSGSPMAAIGEAGVMYGGLYLTSKILASQFGRAEFLEYLRAAAGSPQEAASLAKLTALAARISGNVKAPKESAVR